MPTSYQVSVTVLGIIQLARGRASSSFTGPWFDNSSKSPSSYALALYSGLWAFDGWVRRPTQSSLALLMPVSGPSELCRRGDEEPGQEAAHCHPLQHGTSDGNSNICARIKDISRPPQLLFLSANVSYLVVLDKVRAPRPLSLRHPVEFAARPLSVAVILSHWTLGVH
jgi:hypothetical protein